MMRITNDNKKQWPSWELTYFLKSPFWVDDFPNFPRWDMLISWRVASIDDVMIPTLMITNGKHGMFHNDENH